MCFHHLGHAICYDKYIIHISQLCNGSDDRYFPTFFSKYPMNIFASICPSGLPTTTPSIWLYYCPFNKNWILHVQSPNNWLSSHGGIAGCSSNVNEHSVTMSTTSPMETLVTLVLASTVVRLLLKTEVSCREKIPRFHRMSSSVTNRNYYLMSFWKKTAEISYICCSTVL